MRPIYHITASFLLALLIFALSWSWAASLLVLLSGIFIDLDHLIDFWALKPENPFSVKHFLNTERLNEQSRYIFIFFHGWEWAALLLFLSWLYSWPAWLWGITASIALHLAMDNLFNVFLTKNNCRISPWSYFFFFRVFKRFRKQTS